MSHQGDSVAPVVCRSRTATCAAAVDSGAGGVADTIITSSPTFEVHVSGVTFVPNAPQSFHDRLMPAVAGRTRQHARVHTPAIKASDATAAAFEPESMPSSHCVR